MKDKVFLDTNTLIYLYSDTEPEKKQKVFEIIKSNHIVISLQVIKEFCNICIKKFQVSIKNIQLALNDFKSNFVILNLNINTVFTALSLLNKYNFSFYDSLIISSALGCNCSILYTEDMHNNLVVENKLKIINPFFDA